MDKKILLVANTDWYLLNFRLSLAEDLKARGYEVVFVCPLGEYSQEIQAHGFRIIPWELERQTAPIWSEIHSIYTLYMIYTRENPCLVHHFTIKPVLYGSMAARLVGKVAVINSITGRGYVFQGAAGKSVFLKPLIEIMFRFIYSGMEIATTFENCSDQEFFTGAGLVPARNNWLVNGVGIDTDWFYYKQEQATDEPLVVFPGRLLWSKGVGILVEAARILKEKNTLVRIILVGKPDPGNPETISEEIIRMWEKEGIIEWWGWQSNMRDVYHQSNIIVLPSMGEGLSKALLEALSCGRPIIATDVPGCREVVIPGVTGYLVPINDAQALADRIQKLCANPDLRREMGFAGRRLAEEEFRDIKINAEIEKIYTLMTTSS